MVDRVGFIDYVKICVLMKIRFEQAVWFVVEYSKCIRASQMDSVMICKFSGSTSGIWSWATFGGLNIFKFKWHKLLMVFTDLLVNEVRLLLIIYCLIILIPFGFMAVSRYQIVTRYVSWYLSIFFFLQFQSNWNLVSPFEFLFSSSLSSPPEVKLNWILFHTSQSTGLLLQVLWS